MTHVRQETSSPRLSGVSVGRTPPHLLTDGCVVLRLPSANDRLRLVAYGRDEKLLEGIWITGPFPDGDLDAWASRVIGEALAGWTDHGGVHGGGLVIDEQQPFAGMLYLAPRDNNGLEVSYGVAPPYRGRGIATRALNLIASWATTQAAFNRVELRIAEDNSASRRVAEKSGFRLRERIETFVKGTGETYIDLLYVYPPNDEVEEKVEISKTE
jgi:RimJ/RimL family protein N-acetyltransferase